MLDRYQLEAFASVVETMSFERAAERLNVTRAAISQRIKALEDALSAAVLVRSKPLTLTLAGEVLFKHVTAVRLLEADTFNQIDPQSSRSVMPLAVGVDVYSIDAWFGAVAQQIIKRNVIDLEVVVDDTDPTFPALTRGEIVGSVSTVSRPVHGCVAEPIGDMIYRCVASPAFIERHFPKGFSLHAATSAPAVSVGRRTVLLERYFDATFGVAVGRYRKNLLPSVASQLDTIVADLGYGLLPEQTVLPLLESGRLVDVGRDQTLPVTLYWHRWRAAPPICEAISAEIVTCAREILGSAEPSPVLAPGARAVSYGRPFASLSPVA
ncbi:HTH-type transcriptional regulator ArgP [Burkholderia plantarii]|uniref:Transcriptional regulator, ArgP family n=1 Tax=Burkholderia plantarii TaxID=41899 RepID=A0A0B6S2R5_BURPL|nr:HTH-type transcriptional regulator ArgP [Burkholderia plantarii]AJK47625.1 transcriptional regulator, ArgP family [Burkholderia plantarii]